MGLAWIILLFLPTFVLYILRENTPVKEFIEWVLKDWPILAALGGIAIIISGIIIKHDFGSTKRQTIVEVPKKDTGVGNINITVEGHIPISSEMKRDMKRAQAAKNKLEKSIEKSLRNYLERDDKNKV